jgi:murein DD-endopeptidase MepM/ murein hydrolase activator NlpD
MMPQEGSRRRKTPRLFNILIVPVEEGGKTRSFRTNPVLILVILFLGFLASMAVTLAILVYTPLAMYVPIPNPGLEERYGRQILDTQKRLNAVAEEMVLLRDYNNQLRKAMGEGEARDTSAARALLHQRDEAPAHAANRDMQHAGDEDLGAALDGGGDAGVLAEGGGGGEYGMVSTTPGIARTSFPLVTPVRGFLTQGFDPSRNHFGIDIAAQRGTPIYAAGDGVVVFSGWTYDDGNMVILAHGGGYLTVYKHNQSLLKSTLNGVKRGEAIALLGSSGETSRGPHLHFEVWKNGVPQDPNGYLLVPARTH